MWAILDRACVQDVPQVTLSSSRAEPYDRPSNQLLLSFPTFGFHELFGHKRNFVSDGGSAAHAAGPDEAVRDGLQVIIVVRLLLRESSQLSDRSSASRYVITIR